MFDNIHGVEHLILDVIRGWLGLILLPFVDIILCMYRMCTNFNFLHAASNVTHAIDFVITETFVI
jgi:hypothetical protein